MGEHELRGLSVEDLRDLAYALNSVTNDEEWPPRFHQLRHFVSMEWGKARAAERDAHPFPSVAPIVKRAS